MILYVTSGRFCCILYRRENVYGCACVCVVVCCKKNEKKTDYCK